MTCFGVMPASERMSQMNWNDQFNIVKVDALESKLKNEIKLCPRNAWVVNKHMVWNFTSSWCKDMGTHGLGMDGYTWVRHGHVIAGIGHAIGW